MGRVEEPCAWPPRQPPLVSHRCNRNEEKKRCTDRNGINWNPNHAFRPALQHPGAGHQP
ncbi:MAG: hypothetical protein J6031_07470 [Bacteroidales bacterium]|nr:hypothetical protein [Bacteroidales bacterium]